MRGECCRRFWLEFAPWELTDPANLKRFKELEKFASHIELDSWSHVTPEGAIYWPMPAPFYRCTLLQPDGTCGDYENRPNICSAFPYGGVCNFSGCDQYDVCDKCTKPLGSKLEAHVWTEEWRLHALLGWANKIPETSRPWLEKATAYTRDLLDRARKRLAEVDDGLQDHDLPTGPGARRVLTGDAERAPRDVAVASV